VRTESREILAIGMLGRTALRERIELLLGRGREFSGGTSWARVAVSAAVLAGFLIGGSLAPRWIAFAQQPAPMRFEVASIKPSAPGRTRDLGGIRAEFLAGGFRATNLGIKNLIEIAYRGSYFQISGGPAWIDPDMLSTGDRYSIEAKAAGEASEDQVRRMLQTLLKERFKFQFHREARAQIVYDLVTAKGGPRLLEVHVDNYTGDARMGGGRVITEQMTMRDLAEHLAGQVRSSVTDKTGLTGVYKFTLQWTPENFRLQGAGAPPAGGEPGIDADGPSLFTALQEQLGLRLEPVKGSVDVLVIDGVEKPDAN
jgi:uncharacterized protein (TIGR03435 family)